MAKSSSASCEAKSSLISASNEACTVSGCEITSVLLRAQSRFSREVKGKAPIGAKSETTVASLPVEGTLNSEARVEAPSGANNKVTSLQNSALLNNAKAPSAHIASPHGKAMISAKSRLTNVSKGKSKAKPKTIHPIRANLQPP